MNQYHLFANSSSFQLQTSVLRPILWVQYCYMPGQQDSIPVVQLHLGPSSYTEIGPIGPHDSGT
jgi:hypothetical protein